MEKNLKLSESDFKIANRRIIITRVVAETWDWLHCEKKLLLMRAFQYTGVAL